MINLILDTNILHEEGLHSASMKRLARLVTARSIAVYVPELVKREYVSKRIAEASEKSATYVASLTDFAKKFFADDAMQAELGKISQGIAQAMSEFPAAVESSFSAWQKIVQANVIELDMNSTAKVFEEYFEGKGAFRKLKQRDDIPDAFIANAIIELSQNTENVHVAVKDGVLSKYLSTIAGLEIVSDVKAFLVLPAIKEIIEHLERGDKRVADLKAFFSSNIFLQRLEGVLKNDPERVQGIYVEEDAITGTDHLTVYEFGATINFPSKEDVELLNFGDVVYVENGYFNMPIDFSTTVQVDYCTDYGSYINLPTEKLKLVEESGMNGDGVTDIHEKRTVHFFGTISFQFDEAMSLAEIEIASKKIAYKNSLIVLDMAFDNAAILV